MRVCLVVCLLFSAGPVMANLYCSGTISNIRVDKNGQVWVIGTWRTDSQYTMVCDLDTTWNDLSPGDCKNWYGIMQGAYYTQSPVTFYYGISGIATCTELATNANSPAPQILTLGD